MLIVDLLQCSDKKFPLSYVCVCAINFGAIVHMPPPNLNSEFIYEAVAAATAIAIGLVPWHPVWGRKGNENTP